MEISLHKEEIFSGRILKLERHLVRLTDDSEAYREVVRHPGAVAVVAFKGEELLLVRQYRFPVQKFMLEIPAGIMEEEEVPLRSAQRELAEETGYRAAKWQEVMSFYTAPGFTDEKIHLFLAQELTQGNTNFDPDEFIEILKMPVKEAYDLVRRGSIIDAKSIIGIQVAYMGGDL